MTELEREIASLPRFQATPQLRRPHLLDQLTDMLVLADELLSEFQTEEANALLWLEPHIRDVYNEIDASLKRFAQ